MVSRVRILSRRPAAVFFVVFAMSWLLLMPSSNDRFVQVFLPDGTVITSELAVTDEERLTGLMFREKINPDQGMLFIFDQEDVHPIWMKNMKIPIDILWLDNDKRIVHIEQNVPPCVTDDCPSYAGLTPSKYVLELKQGGVKAHALELFDRIGFILRAEFRR